MVKAPRHPLKPAYVPDHSGSCFVPIIRQRLTTGEQVESWWFEQEGGWFALMKWGDPAYSTMVVQLDGKPGPDAVPVILDPVP